MKKAGRTFDRLDQAYLNGLVTRARQGNSNAFAELFASVADRQLCYLTHLFGSREEAIKVLPEVFTAVHRELPSLAKADLFMPWICRISALKYMGKAGIRSVGGSDYTLSQILNLPLAESQIMLMSLEQGLSDSEIAELMNVGRRTIARFVRMGRRHLAKHAAGSTAKPAHRPSSRKSRLAASFSEITTLETSEILDHVFSTRGSDANTVPMETISSYAVYRKERFTLQRVIIAMALLVFMMLPLMVVLPGYTVKVNETGERGLPVYTVEVDSILPVGKVLATIKEHSLPVYEAGAKEFTVEPTRNGSLDICVELINHQKVSNSYDVTAVDSTGPELLKSETLDDGFLLKVSDAGIGVDYRDIYAVSASGETHYPVSADEEGGVLFEYPGEAWDIYIPDHIGNTLHLAVKIN